MKKILDSFREDPYVPVFSVTLMLSAFLLFSVQPLVSKMILPILGGTPSVWNTAMMFFQITLLAGYAYAHITTRFLGVRMQAVAHIALMIAFVFILPIALPAGWLPPENANPAFWQIGVMSITVGGPFFALAATAPMLQRWFTRTPHPYAGNPYFLYAASNLGSLAALVAYPILIEPLAGLQTQSMNWASGYLALTGLVLVCAGAVWHQSAENQAQEGNEIVKEQISWSIKAMWLVLAFVPSSMLLGVTTFITTDIASVPLFWVLPLAIYVGSFVIAFSRRQIVSYGFAVWFQGFFFAGAVFFMFHQQTASLVLIVVHLALLACTSVICHKDLARLRPSAASLTEFYLVIAAGGALGGIFNAILAPRLFPAPIEYPIALAAAACLRYAALPGSGIVRAYQRAVSDFKARRIFGDPGGMAGIVLLASVCLFAAISGGAYGSFKLAATLGTILLLLFLYRRWTFAVTAAIALGCAMLKVWFMDPDVMLMQRNFFGVVKVIDRESEGMRELVHGTTLHGAQPLAEEHRLTPVTYYSPYTAAGEVFEIFESYPSESQKVAVIGLGVGAVSCYGGRERHYDYYEIDPDIAGIATDPELFTYLRDCGTSSKIIIGDGRVRIAGAEDGGYDMILLDAFSSDSIPVHLLTVEAFLLYRKKLAPEGLIVTNISNRFLDLRPVVATSARDIGMTALFKFKNSGSHINSGLEFSGTLFGVVTENKDILLDLYQRGWREADIKPDRNSWTDDYVNILGVMNRVKGEKSSKK